MRRLLGLLWKRGQPVRNLAAAVGGAPIATWRGTDEPLHWASTDEPLHYLADDMTALAPQVRTKTVDEVLVAAFGFASKLADSGATIVGATVEVTKPLIDGEPDDTLILGTPQVNSDTLSVDGVEHEAGQAVLVEVSAGTAHTRYTIRCTAETDGGETMIVDGGLHVEP